MRPREATSRAVTRISLSFDELATIRSALRILDVKYREQSHPEYDQVHDIYRRIDAATSRMEERVR